MGWFSNLFGGASNTQQPSTVTVDIAQFMDKYRSVMLSNDQFIALNDTLSKLHFFKHQTHAQVPVDIIAQMDNALQAQKEREELYNLVSQYRLAGMEMEKVDMLGAIEQYKQCIAVGETTDMFHAFAHAYERIIVLLHKAKDYESERNYIAAYIKHDLTEAVREKYQQRLTKLTGK